MTDDLYEYHFPPTQEPSKVGDYVHVEEHARFGSAGIAMTFADPDNFAYAPPFQISDLHDPCDDGDVKIKNTKGQSGWVHTKYVTKEAPDVYQEGERVSVSPYAKDSTGTLLFEDGYGLSYEPPFIYIGPDSDGDLVVADREGGEISVAPEHVSPWEVEPLRADDIEASDPVRQPSHYKGGGLEVIDVIEGFDLNYRLGNAQKYLLRAGKKGSDADAITDLKKAVQYINREVNVREGRKSW